jgi:uncharacterized protein (DUF983 family)
MSKCGRGRLFRTFLSVIRTDQGDGPAESMAPILVEATVRHFLQGHSSLTMNLRPSCGTPSVTTTLRVLRQTKPCLSALVVKIRNLNL